MKHVALTSASILAFAAVPAQAQTAPVPQSTPADNANQGAAPAPAATDASGIQDIVVTAQRIEQSAQKAPLPIAVVRPEDLVRENVTRAEDLSRLVPALVAATNGGATTSFFLRGVGNFTSNSYSDPAIAFNYDGVYIGRPSNTQGFFYDLQRVEVLKGPQGTLYGRNATGGAINVIPNRPIVGETSAEAEASYGDYNAVQAQGAVNLPIGTTGAFRLSGTYDRHDGYLSDGTSNQRLFGLRAQVLADLTPNLTTRVAIDYTHDGGTGAGGFLYGSTAFNGTSYVFTPTPGITPDIGLTDPRSGAALQNVYVAQAGRNAEALGTYPSQSNNFWGVTDETNWMTSVGTLTVQAAYREADVHTLSNAASFRDYIIDEHDQQYSLEARFAGSVGPVDYLVGGYYFNESIKAHSAINQYTLSVFQDYATGTESKAGFGRLAYHVTPMVTLTAAGRYTSDSKRFDGTSDIYNLFCGNGRGAPLNSCPNLPFFPAVSTAAQTVAYYQARGILISPIPLGIIGALPPGTPSVLSSSLPIDAVTDTSKFTYRLAADWQVTASNLLYASYETGYHGGGFSYARGLESYQPETIEAYTIGSKNRFFDRRVQLNIEGFYWKYKNQQFSQFGYDLGSPPNLVFYTSNVGRSTNQGGRRRFRRPRDAHDSAGWQRSVPRYKL